jgi:hypothetical protein
MKVPHLTAPFRSAFYKIVMTSLKNCPPPVQVFLDKDGGYSGRHKVTVGPMEELEFELDGVLLDWTRFPARIRAACTALRDSQMPGSYFIAHEDGHLSIELSLAT